MDPSIERKLCERFIYKEPTVALQEHPGFPEQHDICIKQGFHFALQRGRTFLQDRAGLLVGKGICLGCEGHPSPTHHEVITRFGNRPCHLGKHKIRRPFATSLRVHNYND